MQHRIKTYADGFKAIEFCEQCGAEGSELLETSCTPAVYTITCSKCGYNALVNEECGNCQKIQKMFRKAVDKHNSRN